MKRIPIIISLMLALSALTSSQTDDKKATMDEKRLKLLQHYINLIPSSPKEAEHALRSLGTPTSKVYLAYLYYTRKVSVTNPKAQVSRLIKEAVDLIAKDGESSCTGFESDLRLRNQRDLLLAVRLVSGADSRGVTTPCWLFREHPKEAFEAFGAYWGSSCDNTPELCRDYKSITSIDAVKQLSEIVNDIQGKEGLNPNCEGTIIFGDYRHWRIEEMKASMSPRLLLKHAHKNRALLAKRLRILRTWSNNNLWNKVKYRSLVAAIPRAKEALEIYYLSKFGMNGTQAEAASEVAVTSLMEHTAFLDPDEDNAGNISDDPVYKIIARPHVDAQRLADLLASSAIKREALDSALRYAVLNNLSIDIIRLLVDNGAHLDLGKESALAIAVKRPDVAGYFLRSGANPNQQDHYGKTPLFYAIEFDSLESAKLLIEAGADVNHALNSHDELRKASEESDSSVNLCSSDAEDATMTPLMYASRHASLPVIQLLIEKGANIHAKDSEGREAADYLTENHLLKKAEQKRARLLLM